MADPTTFTFPITAFPPLAVGFFGLGTGYLIDGPQGLVGFPERDRPVDLATGLWHIWMPGFMRFITGLFRLDVATCRWQWSATSPHAPSCTTSRPSS